MSAYPPEVVEAAKAGVLNGIESTSVYFSDYPDDFEHEVAIGVLDAVTAATPTLRHHGDGRLSLEWADEPAVGALVVVKALAESPWGVFTVSATIPVTAWKG